MRVYIAAALLMQTTRIILKHIPGTIPATMRTLIPMFPAVNPKPYKDKGTCWAPQLALVARFPGRALRFLSGRGNSEDTGVGASAEIGEWCVPAGLGLSRLFEHPKP